jgi:hypothetical protein
LHAIVLYTILAGRRVSIHPHCPRLRHPEQIFKALGCRSERDLIRAAVMIRSCYSTNRVLSTRPACTRAVAICDLLALTLDAMQMQARQMYLPQLTLPPLQHQCLALPTHVPRFFLFDARVAESCADRVDALLERTRRRRARYSDEIIFDAGLSIRPIDYVSVHFCTWCCVCMHKASRP